MNLASRLARLPREARDTLFLLAVVACCIAPLAAHLPPWASAMTATLLAWRAWLAAGSRPLPGRWLTAVLLALVVLLTLQSHGTIVGRDAGVTLIVMLLALKTLELRARRDAMVVFFLGFFTLLANFFFSQALPIAAVMLVALLGLLTALVNAHMPVGRPPLATAMRQAARMMLLGAPIMALLFLLFPRMAPLWGMPADKTGARTGLSGQMSIGSMASLVLDGSVALRVRFDTPGGLPPEPQDLYFRGPVLTAFNGRDWFALSQPEARGITAAAPSPAHLQVQGAPLRYELTLEPHQRPWLLTLDATKAAPELPQGSWALMSPELQWSASRPIHSVLRYRAESHLRFTHGPLRRTPQMQAYVQLPPDLNPRTLALARQMQADPRLGRGGAQAFVDAALARLAQGGYRYSLEPGLYGEHTADEFWFTRKEGFCEHIASAFVVLMRALDVPARIVTGYQGGQMNAIDGYWTVHQSDAHAWAEVWIAGRGWVRVDPTGAVAPGRVGQLQRLQAPRGVFGAAMDAVVSPTLLQNLRTVWEAVNNGWNQWVLNYTQGRQLDLLKALGVQSPSWQDLVRLLGFLICSSAAAGALWALWERRRQDPWQQLLQRARERLARAGLALPPHLPPRGMAEQARAHLGPPAEPAAQWLLRLEQARYARHPAAALPRLRREFARLPWPAAQSRRTGTP
ncbi:DUF3488 and DUF4129 domain-containing transglutaminase family protein [Alicycliphilus denitrificans]|uniref:transglutaminase TgpA family protein n=1 Tax=Alicycliphilus denitrificans TaxID=179636 RepID=UPI003851534A